MNVFSEGGTPPNFPSPAVPLRCCPPSAEGVACCQSSHKPRGAAAVLPFFSARAGATARCQCLRGWAQAVGHVTPLWMGGLHDFHGGCGRRVNHCAEEGRGPRHTQSFVSEAKDCRHYSIGVFSARGCCLTRWRLQGMFTPCQRASWAAEPTLLSSFNDEYLARTCCGRGYPDTTQRALLLGRVTKEEGPFSRWPPFSLEPHGPRDLL